MKLKHLYIKDYKNLVDFEWSQTDSDASQILLVLGKNGTGKSNLLEAIVHIFKCLHYTKTLAPTLTFKIRYQIANALIEVHGEKGKKGEYKFWIDGTSVPLKDIQRISATWHYPKHEQKLEGILPENIIVYYSGFSTRMRHIVGRVTHDYGALYRKGILNSLPPLLYIEPKHFKMILLALFSFDNESSVYKDFLKKYFGFEGVSSFSIKIHKYSNWVKDKKYQNFFDTKGQIKRYIQLIHETFIESNPNKIPVYETARTNVNHIYNVKYEFNSYQDLQALKGKVGYEFDLFKMLNILDLSGHLDGVQIMLKKAGVQAAISFDELSEGEQQQVAIRGMIELLWEKDNLFLWDEPDSYLNYSWQWDLVPRLDMQIGDSVNNQFIITSHSPAIASTMKKGVYSIGDGKIEAVHNTYGLSVDENLIKQNIKVRLQSVDEVYDKYISLIESEKGQGQEAIVLRQQLIENWGENHPLIQKSNVLLSFYK